MISEPENPDYPRQMSCMGGELFATLDSVQAKGARVEGLKVGRSNAEWVLTLFWPEQRELL